VMRYGGIAPRGPHTPFWGLHCDGGKARRPNVGARVVALIAVSKQKLCSLLCEEEKAEGAGTMERGIWASGRERLEAQSVAAEGSGRSAEAH
jgi:hypothetical protein